MWPNGRDFQDMAKGKKIKLQKIEIWTESFYNYMTGIRVTMSNGEESPIFKTRGQQVGL